MPIVNLKGNSPLNATIITFCIFSKRLVHMWPKVTLFLFILLHLGCTTDNDKEDCNSVACTLNFVTIGVSVKNTSGGAVPLDSFKVTDTASGTDLTLVANDQEFEDYKNNGFYPIFSDAYRLQYQNKSTTISFKGFIGNDIVVTEEFVVGADCCHVSLISGTTDIVID